MPETSLHDGLVDGDAIGRSRKVGVRIDQGALLIAGWTLPGKHCRVSTAPFPFPPLPSASQSWFSSLIPGLLPF